MLWQSWRWYIPIIVLLTAKFAKVFACASTTGEGQPSAPVSVVVT